MSGPCYGNNNAQAAAIATPFASLKAAVAAVTNALNYDSQGFVDVTGMTGSNKILIDTQAKSVLMPPMMTNVGGNITPPVVLNRLFEAPGGPGAGIPTEACFNVFADPTTLATLAVADFSTSADATTGQVSITTNKTYTAGQYEGKILLGSGAGQRAIIASCSAGPNSVLELTSNGTFTAPLTICDYGAEIQSVNVPVFQLLEGQQNIKFCGINFNQTSPGVMIFQELRSASSVGQLVVWAGLLPFSAWTSLSLNPGSSMVRRSAAPTLLPTVSAPG